MKDQFYGALFGLVVGDALGASQVYNPVTERNDISDMSYPSEYGELPGVWTDNTSMTLCLLESLLNSNGVNQKNQLSQYAMWYYDGYLTATGYCDDITDVMLKAIKNFTDKKITNQHPNLLQHYNCSLVRTVAVALYDPELNHVKETIKIAEHSSYTTHGSKLAADACKLLTHMIILAINGADKKQLLSSQVLEGLVLNQELVKLIKLRKYTNHTLDNSSGTNNVYDSLMVSLKCFAETDNFRDGVLMAVNNSVDCNTVAAIYGSLAGAHYGLNQIPWIDELVQTPLIMKIIDRAWSKPTNFKSDNTQTTDFKQRLSSMEFEGSNVEIEVEDEDEVDAESKANDEVKDDDDDEVKDDDDAEDEDDDDAEDEDEDDAEDEDDVEDDAVEIITESDNSEITVKKPTKEIDMISIFQ